MLEEVEEQDYIRVFILDSIHLFNLSPRQIIFKSIKCMSNITLLMDPTRVNTANFLDFLFVAYLSQNIYNLQSKIKPKHHHFLL